MDKWHFMCKKFQPLSFASVVVHDCDRFRLQECPELGGDVVGACLCCGNEVDDAPFKESLH